MRRAGIGPSMGPLRLYCNRSFSQQLQVWSSAVFPLWVGRRSLHFCWEAHGKIRVQLGRAWENCSTENIELFSLPSVCLLRVCVPQWATGGLRSNLQEALRYRCLAKG